MKNSYSEEDVPLESFRPLHVDQKSLQFLHSSPVYSYSRANIFDQFARDTIKIEKNANIFV